MDFEAFLFFYNLAHIKHNLHSVWDVSFNLSGLINSNSIFEMLFYIF